MVYRATEKVQERKDANRRHILETAARVFAANGYHGTTVKEIVDEAGMSVGSFYFYFKNKEDLFETLYDEITATILGAIDSVTGDRNLGPAEKATYAIGITLGFFQKHRELAGVMLIEAVGLNTSFEQKRAESVRRLLAPIENSLEHFDATGQISVPDVKVAAVAMEGSIYNIIVSWLHEETDSELTSYIYPLAVYNLQALKAEFNKEEVKAYVERVLAMDHGF